MSLPLIVHDQGDYIIYDSLPYIEKDLLDPDYEAYAITLIDQEMQRLPVRPHPNVPQAHEVPSFGNLEDQTINKVEYSDLVQRGGTARPTPIDYSKTHSVVDPITSSKSEPDTTTLASWKIALNSAKIDLEYQRNRLINLELQVEFESNLWKYHNSMIDSHQSQPIQKALEYQRNFVDKINAKRKHQQETHMGPKLRILERKWSELIGTNQQLVTAIKLLEDEVDSLRAATGVIHDGSFDDEIAFMDKGDDEYV